MPLQGRRPGKIEGGAANVRQRYRTRRRSFFSSAVLTPDFESWQVRIPAMDFDQQSYHGRRSFYLPQFFKENLSLVRFCTSLLDIAQVRLPAPPQNLMMLPTASVSGPG